MGDKPVLPGEEGLFPFDAPLRLFFAAGRGRENGGFTARRKKEYDLLAAAKDI
jgi:hypothetical protein